MSTMGVAFLAAPKHDDLRNLQFHWVKQSFMTLKFRRYLARARARARAHGPRKAASGPCPKKCLAFFLSRARASFPLLKIAIFGGFHLKSAQNTKKKAVLKKDIR